MLVHICCAVDSHYFLEKIQEEFHEEIDFSVPDQPNFPEDLDASAGTPEGSTEEI